MTEPEEMLALLRFKGDSCRPQIARSSRVMPEAVVESQLRLFFKNNAAVLINSDLAVSFELYFDGACLQSNAVVIFINFALRPLRHKSKVFVRLPAVRKRLKTHCILMARAYAHKLARSSEYDLVIRDFRIVHIITENIISHMNSNINI